MADSDDGSFDAAFLQDVLNGLAQRQKSIPARWFYDKRGSQLFDQITALPEYYPTRTETGILAEKAGEMAARIGADALLVEYGAGSLVKVRYLLDQFERPAGYAPVDISETHLHAAARKLQADYPKLSIHPIAADFMGEDLGDRLPDGGRRVGFFPGSTIGNLSDEQIVLFLKTARRDLGPDALFLIGTDLPKAEDVLVPAYDDAAGVTAAFNLNLLDRANRELGANFNLETFKHLAVWNAEESRIEMHLRSAIDQTIAIAGREFVFSVGETIHTENSRKLPPEGLDALAREAGWQIERDWRDEKDWFSLTLLV